MKKHLIIALAGLLTMNTYSQSGKTPYQIKTFANESIKEVDSRTQGGSIDVSGVNPSEARVEVYISGNNWKDHLSKEEIQQRLNEDYELEVSLTGGKVTAKAKAKNNNMNWKKSLSISFKIFVPVNTSTDLSTSGGSISLTNLNGTEEFRTSGGSLTVNKVSGRIDGQTSGGSIDVADSKDDIDLETSGGSIEAKNCSGKIKLNTSGGSLNLKDLKGTVRATTSGGSVDGVTVDGELYAHTSGGSVTLRDLTCSVDASTSGGNIDVEIKELRDYVKIHNSSGHIDLQLPANKGVDLKLYGEKIKTGTLASFSGSVEEHSVNGKLNGGGTPVTADAGSGRINVTFK
jgi:Toastrack DUF4097